MRRSCAFPHICDTCDDFAQVCDPMLGRVTPIFVRKPGANQRFVTNSGLPFYNTKKEARAGHTAGVFVAGTAEF